MKYRIKVDCSQEDLFQVVSGEFRKDYYRSKGKELDESQMVKGFTYQKLSNRQKSTKRAANVAVVKLLEYEYPVLYRFSFQSDTFYKIIGMEVRAITEEQCEVVFEEYNEKLENGISKTNFSYDGSKEKIRKPNLLRKLMFKRTAQNIKKNKLSGQCSLSAKAAGADAVPSE